MKSAVGLASLAMLVGHASVSSAAPTCTRQASQWTVVFSGDCTNWFKENKHTEMLPEQCNQEFEGGVMVDTFPWNDDVVVVDNEVPGDDFSLQPPQEVVQYGAGIVIMQTTYDLYDGWAWHPREGSSAERVHHEVEYFSSGDEKYLDFDIHVHYGPPPSARMPGGRKPPGGSSYSYTYNDADVDILADDDGSQPNLAGDSSVREKDPWEDLFSGPVLGDQGGGEGGESDSSYSYPYYPTYVYSYEQESYDFSQRFEVDDLESYSYQYVEGYVGSYTYGNGYSYEDSYEYSYEYSDNHTEEAVPVNALQSITSLEIYVCTDEDNNLAELRFYCDPDNKGTAQCYDEAGGPNVQALQIHDMEMYCESDCLNGQKGGLWCDIFGLDGCRMCTPDCTTLCGGLESCSSCIKCPSNAAPATETPAPTTGSRGLETASPTEGSPEPGQSSAPTSSPTGFHPVMFDTPAPTTGSRGLETASPTEGLPAMVNTPTPTTTDGSRGLDTASPTEGFLEPGQTSGPTASSGSLETPSPTEGLPAMVNTPTPTTTDGSRGLETASPGSFGRPGAETASPTGSDILTSSPTSGTSIVLETPAPIAGNAGNIPGSPTSPTSPPTGFKPAAPTPGLRGGESEAPRGLETAAPMPGMPGMETASPTHMMSSSPTPGSRGLETVAPTPGMTGMETPSPTHMMSSSPTPGSRGFETGSPTPGSRGFETGSPTAGSRGFETASPTAGSRGFEMMSAAPTNGLRGIEECTPGDPESCYGQLDPTAKTTLEDLGRGLTCENSCIVGGGLWCKAFGISGCRFCATSCEDFCATQGLPDDCVCFEC